LGGGHQHLRLDPRHADGLDEQRDGLWACARLIADFNVPGPARNRCLACSISIDADPGDPAIDRNFAAIVRSSGVGDWRMAKSEIA
jgi:hypothetical protein